MKTNIILHNPDFKIAYNLWLYIDRTTEVGYNVQSDEKTNDDDDVILNDFNHIGVFLINDLMHQRGIRSLEAFDGEKNVRELKHDDITKYELEPKDIKLSHQEISEYLLSRISEIFEEKYKELGISEKVYAFGEKIEQELKERFEKIDANAEYNQMKVIAAMQKKRQDPVAAKALEYGVSALLGHEICR
mgnify:CR=1 FL=1